MESWKLVLQKGFMPSWATDRLEACLALLKADSPKLVQGSTTTPPPLMCVQDWAVEACDVIAFCSTPDTLNGTVGEAEEGFARVCFECDQRLGEPAACRWFLNWFDDTPRGEVFSKLIEEFQTELTARGRGRLRPDLQLALEQFPDDKTLKMACVDSLIEDGLLEEAERMGNRL